MNGHGSGVNCRDYDYLSGNSYLVVRLSALFSTSVDASQ
jgi:hypothetical protein